MNLDGVKRLFRAKTGMDGLESARTRSFTAQEEKIDAYLSEVINATALGFWTVYPSHFTSAKEILGLSREEQAIFAAAAAERTFYIDQQIRAYRATLKDPHNPPLDEKWRSLWLPRRALAELLALLMRKRLPFSENHVAIFAKWGAEITHLYQYPLGPVVASIEELERQSGGHLSSAVREDLGKLLAVVQKDQSDQVNRKLLQRLQVVLGAAPRMPLEGTDVWSHAAIIEIGSLSDLQQTAWINLLEHCAQATGGKPGAKWFKLAENFVETIGAEDFRTALCRWLPLVDKPRPADMPTGRQHQVAPLWISDYHADILKGLVWCCECAPSAELLRAMTALALSSYRKIPGLGPRLTKVGNACIHTLGTIGGLDAIGQLAILRVRVKFGTAQAMLEKALNATAEKASLPREELEEMSVPSYGLTEVGRTTFEFGDVTAALIVSGNRSVEIEWANTAGKPVKSVPGNVKKDYAEDLKELRQAQKDIERMLGAQSERLDNLFLLQKSWPFETWRERYLDHPLVGVLARRLIWKFDDSATVITGIWNDDRLEDVDGTFIPHSCDTTVSLWHPIESSSEVVRQWRERMESLAVRQPFKQAHREVYLLTPAEETTRVYSNRFASHVIKQHQFNALCGQRGWKNKLRLMVDDVYPPASRVLPGWNLRAEFWIEGIGSDYGADTNEAGVYLYLSTDQVRFYAVEAGTRMAHASGGGYRPGRGQNDDPLPLDQIPPLVFSEIMRDVDLFVGVCSVGNDPAWSDGGPQGRYRDYWHDYSFGALSGTAATRKDILERLIPRLKIAAQCSFLDRYLVVKGSLHEYKIHLGSGNILMSPNDRYLCIVARQSTAPGKPEFFLPFEGDNMLSVIISKAFLLAADTKITDPTILQQIKR